MFKKIFLIILLFSLILIACHQTTEQTQTEGSLRGTVMKLLSGEVTPVFQAFILDGDNLLAVTDSQGSYRINDLNAGNYQITGSALFCGDSTLSVQIRGGQTSTLNFTLISDSTTGIVIGEFQDGTLWEQRLQEDASLASWTEQQICDATTGATLQAKWLEYLLPDRVVSLSDSSLTVSDVWGQYGIIIPCGTYPFTGSCDGYGSVTHVVQVLPDVNVYKNFILPREVTAKLVSD